jgi:FixJ family two-component response regulator
MKNFDKNKGNTLVAIVDDDVYVCEAVESLLKSIGFRTATFNSARDFLDSPEFSKVSCLILDVSMPVMNGLELQRHLVDSHPIPIIFITARNGDARDQALRAGAISFLTKPFSDEALIDALDSALGRER